MRPWTWKELRERLRELGADGEVRTAAEYLMIAQMWATRKIVKSGDLRELQSEEVYPELILFLERNFTHWHLGATVTGFKPEPEKDRMNHSHE